MAILLTGGTGFVGQALLDQLHDVIVTSRNSSKAAAKLGLPSDRVIGWNPGSEALRIPAEVSVDAVVNLMGEPIAEGRWNQEKKQRIRDSRVIGTQNLVDTIIASGNLPRVFVSASAIGIYGDSGEAIVDEQYPHGTGFLTDVCEEWEGATKPLSDLGVRVVHLRIGLVIGDQGGVIEKLAPIFRWCLGGPLGNGKQWMSWIHVDDLVSMISFALENEKISGPINATAPNPVRNLEFTKALAKAVGRPAIIPAPKFGVKLLVGEFADSLFFSQRVVPSAALASGFSFKFTDVENAIEFALR